MDGMVNSYITNLICYWCCVRYRTVATKEKVETTKGCEMKYAVYYIGVATWIAGVVIAKGAWSTVFAIFFPFWAWYLFIEKLMILAGMI